MRRFIFASLVFALTGCMHLKGVVLEDVPGPAGGASSRPMRTAVLTIGRPNGIAVYGTQHVDEKGRFDFYIGPTDYSQIFVYDGAANPEMTMRRLGETEFSDHMILHLRRASPGSPSLPTDININQ